MSVREVGVADAIPMTTPPTPAAANSRATPRKLILGILGLVVVIYLLVLGSQALSIYASSIPKLMQAVLASIGGVGGAAALFYFLNMSVEGLPRRLSLGVIPYAFLLPAFGVLGVFLLYPALQTIEYAFANADSTKFIGLENFRTILGDQAFRTTLLNNLLWLALVPAVTVVIGTVIATLADKLSARWEKIAKSLIFLPMAISFVGAATIWNFVYAYKPKGQPQIGLLNAIVVKLGFDPITWLQQDQFNLNDMLLMVIVLWLQTGFAMVLLSSAIKGVPGETIEAARIDGASELQIFFQVIIPQIQGTIITVFITVLIMVLKVFDVVYVLTNGLYGTSVIGLDFFKQIFTYSDAGKASAIVVILLVAMLPVLLYQVHHFREEEKTR
ncbi:MAG: carbohydrate ABC transporter permease [Nocardioidaceae bacterium]